MADQRPDDRYDWLYDDGRRSSAPQQGADLPPPNLPPPGGGGPGGVPPERRPKRRRRGLRLVGLLIGLWIVFLLAVPVWAWSQVTKVDAEPDGDRPGSQPGNTYLLVGSDSRAGLSKEQQQELATGGDSGGRGRTDTMLLLHTGDGPTTLLSIPRDSIVPIEGYGTTKINAAYAYGGPALLVQTIEQNTGIRIDGYVEIGFGGLVNVVDALGGIEICPEEAISDRDSGLDVEAGCQEADGATALAYSRNRHSYSSQDIQRVQAQREVIGAIGSEVRSPWSILNPLRYFRLGDSAADSLSIGENVGPLSAGRFALALSGAMSGDGLNCTVPLRDFAVTWDATRAPQMFELIAGDRTDEIGDLCTADGLP